MPRARAARPRRRWPPTAIDAAIAADAPTSPPSRNVRSPPRRSPPSTIGSYDQSRCSSARSAISRSTSSSGSPGRSQQAATPTPRSVSARAGRPRTSQPGRRRSAPARVHREDRRGRRWCARAQRGSARYGVEVVGPIEGATASICSLVAPDGERSMAADRGAATRAAARRDRSRLARRLRPPPRLRLRADASSPSESAALHAAELARAQGARDQRRPRVLERDPRQRRRRVRRRCSQRSRLTSCSRTRTRSASSAASLVDAAWILKRGAGGCSFDGDERAALPVERVIDSTGAGDALAAGWIVGGPELALEAAARCVGQLGAMPLASPA